MSEAKTKLVCNLGSNDVFMLPDSDELWRKIDGVKTYVVDTDGKRYAGYECISCEGAKRKWLAANKRVEVAAKSMEHVPFFSVIVPAHNSAEWIRKGLDSIREQSFKDYELIIVCDACTDNTAEIAGEYADKLIITDFGLDGMARNAGLDRAEGEWILFMDDDDWFMHEFVFRQLADVVGSKGEDILSFSFIWKGVGFQREPVSNLNIAAWCKCWRRSFIGETRFSDKPNWSDVDFHKAMMAKKPRAVFLDYPMYYYNYMRPGSISWKKAQGLID